MSFLNAPQFCPLCAKNGKKTKILPFSVNLNESVLLCSSVKCTYPFGEHILETVPSLPDDAQTKINNEIFEENKNITLDDIIFSVRIANLNRDVSIVEQKQNVSIDHYDYGFSNQDDTLLNNKEKHNSSNEFQLLDYIDNSDVDISLLKNEENDKVDKDTLANQQANSVDEIIDIEMPPTITTLPLVQSEILPNSNLNNDLFKVKESVQEKKGLDKREELSVSQSNPIRTNDDKVNIINIEILDPNTVTQTSSIFKNVKYQRSFKILSASARHAVLDRKRHLK